MFSTQGCVKKKRVTKWKELFQVCRVAYVQVLPLFLMSGDDSWSTFKAWMHMKVSLTKNSFTLTLSILKSEMSDDREG